MSVMIYYYTGTGNSLWVAKTLMSALGALPPVPIKNAMENETIPTSAQIIGLVFPVHIWGMPKPVVDFVNKMENDPEKYYFAVAVNAGQVARTILQMKALMQSRGLMLASGFEVCLPSNYIPWGGPGPEHEQQQHIQKARTKIGNMADRILHQERGHYEKGPWWQNMLFSVLYQLSFSKVVDMDRGFWVDEKCNHCRICEKICPARNITLSAGQLTWHHRCEQCLACLQWCPQQAIQYGKKTAAYTRYHHPEIQLHEVLAQRFEP